MGQESVCYWILGSARSRRTRSSHFLVNEMVGWLSGWRRSVTDARHVKVLFNRPVDMPDNAGKCSSDSVHLKFDLEGPNTRSVCATTLSSSTSALRSSCSSVCLSKPAQVEHSRSLKSVLTTVPIEHNLEALEVLDFNGINNCT